MRFLEIGADLGLSFVVRNEVEGHGAIFSNYPALSQSIGGRGKVETVKLIHGVHEVRMFRPNGVAVGYFDNLDDALRVVEHEPSPYKACYVTLNPVRLPASIPVNPQTLTPSKNSAGDTDIERRVRLFGGPRRPRARRARMPPRRKNKAHGVKLMVCGPI